MKDLIQHIEQWAEDRNIINGSTPQKQMLKLMEEFGELCSGVAKNKPDVVKDSIGDCFVVLVILRQQLGITGSEYHFAELTVKFKMPARFTTELACLDFGVHYGELARNIGMIDSFGVGLYPANIVFNLIRCYGSLLAITYAQNLKIEDCVQHAYNQIKHRKGKMIDGVFVKEEDLNEQHWHNTTDCLPPKRQKVLIFRQGTHETFQAIRTSDSPVMWFTGMYYIKGEEITHWQEIILPKESEDD